MCAGDQTCAGGNCVCRSGLTSCNGACVDLKHDFNNCGGCGQGCNNNSLRCVDGMCKLTLCQTLGQTNCNGGCYSDAQLNRDPLNCGGCGNACNTDEVCAQGTCSAYFPATACNTCPCNACGSSTKCCATGSTSAPICVQGSACPG